jgi:hypothetical protein
MARRLTWACGLLLAALPCASAFGDTLAPVTRDQLCVTEGSLAQAPGGQLSVADPAMRAILPGSTGQAAEADFTYLGPTAVTSALGSGEVRQQFGLKLRAADPCNLVYAMWRFAPKAQVVVQVKTNPGQHASSVCHNQGYATVAPSQVWPVAQPAPGEQHRLAAAIVGSTLTVQVDGAPVWEGDLGPDALALNGPVGVRSDNASLTFALLAPTVDPAATGACQAEPED